MNEAEQQIGFISFSVCILSCKSKDNQVDIESCSKCQNTDTRILLLTIHDLFSWENSPDRNGFKTGIRKVLFILVRESFCSHSRNARAASLFQDYGRETTALSDLRRVIACRDCFLITIFVTFCFRVLKYHNLLFMNTLAIRSQLCPRVELCTYLARHTYYIS